MDDQLFLTEPDKSKTELKPDGSCIEIGTINMDIHPMEIIKFVSLKLSEEMRILDIRNPQILTALVISQLGEWGLLDGSYYNMVKQANLILEKL